MPKVAKRTVKPARPAIKPEHKGQAFSPELLKQLINNDEAVRDEAFGTVEGLLKSKRKIPFFEMQKLWKALWYHMWHSDTPLKQQGLAQQLADLVAKTTPQNRQMFVRAFWSICVREFETLDRYRINKYYMLTRLFLNAVLTDLLASNQPDYVHEFQDYMVGEGPLNYTDTRFPHNLRLHIVDVYLDEVEKVISSSPPATDTLREVLNPVLSQATSSEFEHVQARVQQDVLTDARLVEWGILPKPVQGADHGAQSESSDEETSDSGDEDADEDDSDTGSWNGFDE